MTKTFGLQKHALINMYMFNEFTRNREATLTEPNRLSLSNMYYISILDFDLKELAAKKIISASLEMQSLNKMESLAVEVSTVSQKWDPDYCNNYYSEKDRPWGVGGWFSEVILSAGHSRDFREKVSFDENTNKVTIKIAPYVINAMAVGQSFGFALMDVRSRFYVEPNDVTMRRMDFEVGQKNPPVLTIEYEDAPDAAITPVGNFNATPLSLHESEGSSVMLSWEGEYPEGVHYRLFIQEGDKSGWNPLPKYFTPNASENITVATIEGLSSDTLYNFAIEATDGLKCSERKFASARTLQGEIIPAFPAWEGAPQPSSENIAKNDIFSISATDDINKADPLTGKLIAFDGNEPVINNGIYDGKSIRLMAAPGEKQAFSIIVAINGEAGDFTIKAAGSGAGAITFSKLWCLNIKGRWYPDIAVPLAGGAFSVPFAENNIAGQKALQLLVDIDIEKTTKPGMYPTDIIIAAGGAEAVLPVLIEVLPAIVPRGDFVMELNGYIYLPRCAGYDKNDPRNESVEREYYRLGQAHYGTVNILPYDHGGNIQPDYAPQVSLVGGEMRVTDWGPWDAHFEKFLDGSFMEEITGEKTPVTHIYLPINENWPMKMKDYYKVNEAPEGLKFPDNVTWHHRSSGNVYEDFKPGYREGIKSVLKDFIWHIEEKGWKQATFQYFFNNKNFYKEVKDVGDESTWKSSLSTWLSNNTTTPDGSGSSWWLLDEPHSRIDWEALAFYASILREAQQETGAGSQIKFRADLSCFNQAFDFLDGMLDVNVVGGHFASERQSILRRRRRLYGENYWPYGGWNGIDASNVNSLLWILDVYLQGADGIIPWYNFGIDLNFEQPESVSALYPGKRFGIDGALASMRLKAGRRAMELIKYMGAFKKMTGYSDRQLKKYVSSFVPLKGETVKTDNLDAGTAVYANAQNGLEALKRDMLRKLALRQPTPPVKTLF